MSAIWLLAGIILIAGVLGRPVISSVMPSDRAAFAMPDTQAWPGNSLSEEQVRRAISYFSEPKACDKWLWRWALIGPGDYLLKGTQYRVVDAYDAPVPNVHIVRGYWGGELTPTNSVIEAKLLAQYRAARQCGYNP